MSEDNKSFYTDEVLQMTVSLTEAIEEARVEAIKRGIDANTVMISKRLAYVNGFDFTHH